jgi:C-terminal processing protease CtpA/Prc
MLPYAITIRYMHVHVHSALLRTQAGIGICFTKDTNAPCKIVKITPGGPAALARLQVNECIHEIDGNKVHSLGEREVLMLVYICVGALFKIKVPPTFFFKM